MAKHPRKKKSPGAFTDAINFASIAQNPKGLPYQQHTRLADGYAMATDGVLTAGHPITSDTAANAHTRTLKAALGRCGETYSVTHIANESLRVESGSFRATVPCLPPGQMLPITYDESAASLSPRLLEGLRVVAPLAVESASQVALASILVGPGSMVATNGTALIEYWHGLDLPPGMVWPKSFVTALLKIGKEPVGLGYSVSRVTLHFEDGSFLASQLYSEKWPTIEHIIAGSSNPVVLPDGLVAACQTVADFTGDGAAYTFEGKIGSHAVETQGATVDIDKLPASIAFSVSDMLTVLPHAETADFAQDRKIYLFGPDMRAVVAKRGGP